MLNSFKQKKLSDFSDEVLVEDAVNGSEKALEELILRYQSWIYNIALRMVMLPEDAEDVTQEILIKMMTKLSSFKGKSKFRTWLYRIVINHVLNMKKKKMENHFTSFEKYGKAINNSPNYDLPDPNSLPVEVELLLEEIKIHCMMGMLLCLDRKSRLIFILGEIIGIDHNLGSKIFEISKDNYRKKLSRARKQLFDFMKDTCGLVNENNSCHCRRKLKGLIDYNEIDPLNLKFNKNYSHKIKQISKRKYIKFSNWLNSKCRKLFQEQPFQNSPDFVSSLRYMLQSEEFYKIFEIKNNFAYQESKKITEV